MSDTSAPLRPTWVAMACTKVMVDIDKEREKMMTNMVLSKLNTDHYRGKTLQEIRNLLPEYEVMIPRMHRVDDMNRLQLLMELASMIPDPENLYMQVSIDDFALIRKWYGRR